MSQVYVALGSNQTEPKAQLDCALKALTKLSSTGQLQVSTYYRSAPMGNVPQDDYINAVVGFTTHLSPITLLDALQQIENQQGRVRQQHWGPRTLDLDILLYEDQQIHSTRLTLPHYGLKQRSFVLIPLFDIAPKLILPCGTHLSTLVNEELRLQLQALIQCETNHQQSFNQPSPS